MNPSIANSKNWNVAEDTVTLQWLDASDQASQSMYETACLTNNANGNKLNLSMRKVEYEKRIYKPGKVHLTMNVTGTFREAELPSLLRQYFATTRVNVFGHAANQNGLRSEAAIAQNYYIHSLSVKRVMVPKPQSVGTSKNVFVRNEMERHIELTCYSPDNKLDIDKYSNVYSNIKFSELLKNEIENGMFKDKGIKFKLGRLCNTCYTKDGDDNNKEEMVQSYLVQYQETFYEFITRIASRCGEFLYYEDDVLYYGLPETAPDKNTFKALQDMSVLDYPDICIDFDNEGLDRKVVGSYLYGAAENPENNDATLQQDQFTGKGYYKILDEKDAPSYWGDIIGEKDFIEGIGSGFQAESVPEFISKMITKTVTNCTTGLLIQKDADSAYKTKYVDDEQKRTYYTSAYINDEIPYTTRNSFYHRVKKGRERASQYMTTVNTEDSLQNIQLGDSLRGNAELNITKYIVVGMHGVMSNEVVQDYKDHDGFNGKGLFYKNTPVENHYIEAIPVFGDDDHIYPPLTEDSPEINTALSVDGVVDDVEDPLRLGRVKVKFTFQNNDITSPWIPVAVPFTGGSGGINFTLEKGERVIINFFEGDVERPYVVGAYFTLGNKPNYGKTAFLKSNFLPSYTPRTISSASGHCISFIDKKGGADFMASLCPPVGQLWRGAKTIAKYIDSDSNLDFDYAKLGGGIVIRDELGIYEIEGSTHNRKITINSPIGSVEIDAFTGITISAPNGDVKIKGKNVSIEAGNQVQIVSGKNIQDKEYKKNKGLETLGGIIGSLIKDVAANAALNYAGVDPTKWLDVSFLRNCWEVLMRPVDGTLQIQSKRNVTMTAGKGAVTVPSSLLSNATIKKKGVEKSFSDFTKDEENGPNGKYLTDSQNFQTIWNCVNDVYNKYYKHRENIAGKLQELKAINLTEVDQLKSEKIKDGKFIFMDDFAAGQEPPEIQEAGNLRNEPKEENEIDQTQKNFAEKAFKLYDEIKNIYESKDYSEISVKLKNSLEEKIQAWNSYFDSVTKDLCKDNYYIQGRRDSVPPGLIAELEIQKKKVFRTICYDILKNNGGETLLYLPDQILDENGQIIGAEKIIGTDAGWLQMVASITDNINNQAPAKDPGLVSGFIKGIAPLLGGAEYDDGLKLVSGRKLLNYNGAAGPRSAWDVGHGGSILISNSPGTTYKLAARGDGWEPYKNNSCRSVVDYLRKATIDAAQ